MIIGNQQQRSTESPGNQQSLCPDNRAPRDEVTDRRGHKSNTEKITKNSQKNAGQRKKKVLPTLLGNTQKRSANKPIYTLSMN